MSKQASFSRRNFLRATGTLSVGLGTVGPNIFLNRTKAATGQNPSEFIRVGFIGVANQGNVNLGGLMKNAVAVCDVDQTHLKTAQARVEKANNRPCAVFDDYRRMLEDKSIDAVLVSTPDHWHTLIAINACEAGKDIYCEKPLTLTIAEGQALAKAVRRYKRVLQTGSQQRSEVKFRTGCEYVRNGRLGKIHTIKVGLPGVNWEKRGGAGVPDGTPPPELNYDRWLGPAPARPYNKNRVHYLFRFFWDYSGGQMTNWGAHHLDIAQWGLGMDDSGPVEVEGSNVVYHPDRLFETPQKFDVTYKYASGTKLFCSSGTGKYKGGTLFEGEKGSLFVSRGNLETTPETILEEPLDAQAERLYVSHSHHQNWLDCIKSRQDPICNVDVGHRSATVCHLGSIAVRTGKKVVWDPRKQEIVGDPELAQWVSRPYRAPWKLPT